MRALVFTIIYIVLSPDSQRELQMPKQRQTQPWSEPSWARDRLHPAHWASTQLPYTEFLLKQIQGQENMNWKSQNTYIVIESDFSL